MPIKMGRMTNQLSLMKWLMTSIVRANLDFSISGENKWLWLLELADLTIDLTIPTRPVVGIGAWVEATDG